VQPGLEPTTLPLISCIMPTADRRRFVPEAIRLFLGQDYPDKELVVLDDGEDEIADLIPADPRIRYLRQQPRRSIGIKRNLACAAARGDIIAHWDDDDWYAPWRLSRQAGAIVDGGADLCGLDRVTFYDPAARRAWEYVYPAGAAPWIYGATLCYRKSLWQQRPFPDLRIGEDTTFVAQAAAARVRALAEPGMFVGLVHRANTSPKRTHEPWWQPLPLERIASIVGDDWAAAPRADVEHHAEARPAGIARSDAPVPARIRVGIHVHSEPERLTETLTHLRAHSPAGIEIVLLGDGPDDATRAALEQLGNVPQSTTVEPRGAAACFNRLIGDGDAELLIFLESGSLVGADWLGPIVAALQADPRNGLAGPSTNRSWNQQALFRGRAAGAANLAALATAARAQFGERWQTLEPLYCLADFCYAVRRDVVNAIGVADEDYGSGPCWEMDYTIRAVRSGFRPVWAQGAYVFRHPFSPRRVVDEARYFAASRQRYQDKFCGLKLNGTRPGYAQHCRGEDCTHFAPADRIARVIPPAPQPTRLPARREPRAVVTDSPVGRAGDGPPLISCIMPTRDRVEWVLQSIGYFARQDYPNRELIIVDDGTEHLAAVLPPDPRIRHLRVARPVSIGVKRNLGCEAAAGTVICHWDDDDWYAPQRLSAQAAPILSGAAEITALTDTLFFELASWRFWRCSPDLYARLFVHGVHGGTLMFARPVFGPASRYPDLSLAEDAVFLRTAARRSARIEPVDGAGLFVYVRHTSNAWRFACGEVYGTNGWRRCAEPAGFAADRGFYARLSPVEAGDQVS
jgi:glycosyltransferase involved in cell wall biosynthesis